MPLHRPLILLLATAALAAACAREVEQPPASGAEHGHAEQAEGHGEAGGHEEQGHGSEGHGEAEHPDEHGHAAEGQVTLDADAQRAAGIRVAPLAERALPALVETTGTFEADADREAHVTARIPGRVVRVAATVGRRVRAGEPLAVLESVELGQAQVAYLQAQARHDLAASVVARQRKLYAGQVAAQKDVLAAENAARQAAIELEGARNQLALFGFDAGRTARLLRTRKLDPTVPVLAPIAGTVVARHVTLGETLRAGDAEPAFVLSDPAALWVSTTIPERDLDRVAVGQAATVTTGAFPGRTFPGRVALLASALAPTTRTARARVVVANPGGKLRPQMFAKVAIATGTRRTLAVPEAAVNEDTEARETFVFVREAADRFEKRVVQLGPEAAGHRPVLGGLAAGDPVVVEGGFTLKSELLKESFGEHEH
jgi:cobalt-zinc-cadmium efflux system membrane fusion protein